MAKKIARRKGSTPQPPPPPPPQSPEDAEISVDFDAEDPAISTDHLEEHVEHRKDFSKVVKLEMAPAKRRKNIRMTIEVKMAYLRELSRIGLKTRAAAKIGVSPKTINNHLRADPTFKEAEAFAMECYRETLVREAHRRAVEGTERPAFYQGMVVGKTREYSDRLLELMLKRHIPEFKDKLSVEATLTAGVLVVGARPQTVEEWEKRYGSAKIIDIQKKKEEGGTNGNGQSAR